MRGLFLLVIALGFFSCKTPKNFEDLTEADKRIEMTRGACFGMCPIYTITVYEGGYCALDAKRFGKRQGKFKRLLSKKEYKSLLADFENANLYQFADEYPSQLVDLALITMTYYGAAGEKTIKGRDERPAEVLNLQYKLEALYNKDGWLLTEGEPALEKFTPTEARVEEVIIKDRIIIKPAQGTKLPMWFKEMDPYGVRLIRKVSEDLNLWLITYDQSKVTPEKMLSIIKNHSGIEMAEFDKNVSNRSHN